MKATSETVYAKLKAQCFGILPIDPEGKPVYDNILHYKRLNHQTYPASITKVMTALVALEYLSLDQKITIIEDDIVTGSGYNLKAGDVISIQDLIINMMLPSSNIAAKAIARATSLVAGLDFVAMMNSKARQLDMTSTVFKNPTGLPDSQQLSTVKDMMRLGVAASKHPDFSQLWGLKTASLTVTGLNARTIKVESSFLKVKQNPWCLGGKSGSFKDCAM